MANEWQGDSGHRQGPQNSSDVYQSLKANKGCQAGRTELRKHITRIKGNTNTNGDENYHRKNYYRTTGQSHLFGDCRVDIIGVGDGDHFRIAQAEPSSRGFTRRNSENSLGGLKGKLVEPDI